MARLQVLQLPEGAGDDRPPFVLVIDEAPTSEEQFDALRRDMEASDITARVGARAVVCFEETIDIPANEMPAAVYGCSEEHADTAEIIGAHEQTRLALCDALLLSFDTTWHQLIEQAAERQREVADLCRELDALKVNPNQHKAAITDALGMDRLRDWDDIRNAAAGLRKERDAKAAVIECVLNLPEQPQVMAADRPPMEEYLHGYGVGVRAAKRAARNEPARAAEDGI